MTIEVTSGTKAGKTYHLLDNALRFCMDNEDKKIAIWVRDKERTDFLLDRFCGMLRGLKIDFTVDDENVKLFTSEVSFVRPKKKAEKEVCFDRAFRDHFNPDALKYPGFGDDLCHWISR